jgi:hypothetical protein
VTAFLLTLALFGAWWLIGLAVLIVVRADLTSLGMLLTAPVVGSVATVLLLFVLSDAGVAMNDGAVPLLATVFVASALVVARRRPKLPAPVITVVGVGAAAMLLVGWPMLGFGFRWIANANHDMSTYSLSALQLSHHGLLAPIDVLGYAQDRDFATTTQPLHSGGARPGGDIALAALSSLTGRFPYEVYMPLIVALNACAVCGAAALALQASRRWLAAVVAATLAAVSPLATYGVVQQLLPQVWGLGLAAVLCAVLMRRELHASPARASDLILISVLAAALILVYVEISSTIALAYALYVGLLAKRRQLSLRAAIRLWLPTLGIAAVVLNTYLIHELRYLHLQATHGLAAFRPPIFGYALVPGSLPGILGLQTLPPPYGSTSLEVSIALSLILLAGGLVASVLSAARGAAASTVLVCFAALGLLLAMRDSDFGLFKLFMFVQPFLAAAVAVWFTGIRTRAMLATAAIPLTLVVLAQASTQAVYVERSRNPRDLRHASSHALLPTFRHIFAQADEPVLSVTENPTLAELEAASIGRRRLHFVTANVFGALKAVAGVESGDIREAVRKAIRLDPWKPRSFDFHATGSRRMDTFEDNTYASTAIAAGRCVLVTPSGSQLVLNRRSLPEGSPDLRAVHCDDARNLLIFTNSALGQGFYIFKNRKAISFYQLERDYFYRGKTFSGFGRYVLFRVLNPSARPRLEVSVTSTLRADGSNRLPPARAVGAARVPFSVVGRGSARLFSAPLRPQIIAGQPYLVLDMGVDGRLAPVGRPGLEGLYGRSVPLDPRYLTSYVRDISLVTDAEYRQLRPPSVLRSFPADLANPDLEYSGLYEDGWMAEKAYVVLAGGDSADLVFRADVAHGAGRHLRVLVNGRKMASRPVAPGLLNLRVPLPASRFRRRIELQWEKAVPLPPPNRRPVTAFVRFLGLVSGKQPSALSRFPGDLANPNLKYSGIYKDGWVAKDSWALLAGGSPATLRVRALVPPRVGGQHLEVTVNGVRVASETAKPGALDLRIPVHASRSSRRVELHWSGTIKLKPPDKRHAAALLKLLALTPIASAPQSIDSFPADLKGLDFTGIDDDGWLEQNAYAVLAGGPPATLRVRALVPPRVGGQRLDVTVNGRRVASKDVKAGTLGLQVQLPASKTDRRIELHWAGTIRLKPPDTRHAAARLKLLSVGPPLPPPTTIARLPADLKGLDYRGIYDDGWLAKDAYAVFAGGKRATLAVKALVPRRQGGQHLDVSVNGRRVASRAVKEGELSLQIPLPASKDDRRVELRWAGTIRLKPPDTRRAAAQLVFMGLEP